MRLEELQESLGSMNVFIDIQRKFAHFTRETNSEDVHAFVTYLHDKNLLMTKPSASSSLMMTLIWSFLLVMKTRCRLPFPEWRGREGLMLRATKKTSR